ncbi:DegV family protein [Peribacillus butanolivorans]|uniref:DegV family protein n=1 Tax=Peribacillus butanolivorans TaxID=421767 RepID=UPI0006FEBC87|nr:fatty acid-binding protein DegV [Bacillus sp. Leaf13]
MERIAWVTDSTGLLDEELSQNEHVYVVPMIVIIDGKEYEDGVDLSSEELYRRMNEEKINPTTSQPSVGRFYELYKMLEKRYDRVISVHLSSKLSGTVSASQQAAQMVTIPVDVFDSLLISFPMLLILKRLMYYVENGHSIDEAFVKTRKYADSHETYVLIGSLDQLYRSGRLTNAQYFLGSLLSFKPIISIEDGLLHTKSKPRNLKKAEKQIFSDFRKSFATGKVKECTILYGALSEQTQTWKAMISEEFPNVKTHVSPLGSAIGVHTGEQTIGISWFNED